VYEARIRYLSFERIQKDIDLRSMVLYSNSWCRGVPLEALLSSASIRFLCIERVLMMAQKKEAEHLQKEHGGRIEDFSNNTEVTLKQLLLEIALNFDELATRVLCLRPAPGQPLHTEATKQFLQAEPLSQDVSIDTDDPDTVFSEADDKDLLEGLAKAADVGGDWYDSLELLEPSTSSPSGPDDAEFRIRKKIIEL